MSRNMEKLEAAFAAHYGEAPSIIVRAPGRVNIIGEHTDYNHGFVLPMAIERDMLIAARPREDRLLKVYDCGLDVTAAGDLAAPKRQPDTSWMDYPMGVADELAKLGKAPQRGADIVILGGVPLGCGLSSSAAFEMASLCLFEALDGYTLDGAEAARLGQRVENDFLGLSTGIMDQFISRCGKAGHALFLDCRSYEYDLVPVAIPGALFVIVNTCCPHKLTSSKYNERVAECKEAVAAMSGKLAAAGTHLRDYTLDDLDACKDSMSEVAFRRARHVITEDGRTQAACEAMRAGDAEALGKLMTASDDSLREDYEVTSGELDAMTRVAKSLPGCFGSRMTGAGFGGCTISLVAEDQAEAFGTALLAGYKEATGIEGEIILSNPAEGAGIVRG